MNDPIVVVSRLAKMLAKSSNSEDLSVELDAVMETIGAEKKDHVSKKTPILTKKGHRVMWLCEVDGELMVLQKLRDFRESEKGSAKEEEEEVGLGTA